MGDVIQNQIPFDTFIDQTCVRKLKYSKSIIRVESIAIRLEHKNLRQTSLVVYIKDDI